MNPLTILLANPYLDRRTGSELYLRDVAEELQCAGHTPLVYSPCLGDIAAELRQRGIWVAEHLEDFPRSPDLVFGHHHFTTLSALLRFPGVPGIGVCHSAIAWQDEPLRMPRLRRYVAVDELCRERLLRAGIPQSQVAVVANGIDLGRFRPRQPLPSRPRRALLYSNYATYDSPLVAAVRRACETAGVQLDVIGAGVGRSAAEPENLLGQYDLVFAKARSALEAIAVGSAVVLCASFGIGPMVTSGNFAELRRWNFGRHLLREPVSARVVGERIARFDAADAAATAALARFEAGREHVTAHLLEIFRAVVAAPVARDDEAEARAVAAYLRSLEPYIRRSYGDLGSLELLVRWRRRVVGIPIVGRLLSGLAGIVRH